jgi:hypothetical protein
MVSRRGRFLNTRPECSGWRFSQSSYLFSCNVFTLLPSLWELCVWRHTLCI